MKKIFKIIAVNTLLIFSFIQFSNSQMIFGINTGLNLSYLTGRDSIYFNVDNKYKNLKPGANIKMLFDINIGYQRFVEIGAIYSQEGVNYRVTTFEPTDTGTGTVKIIKIQKNNLQYLKIPLSWKQIWGDWYTVIGMYGAIALLPEAKWINKFYALDRMYSDTGKFKLDIFKYDMGINLGFGLQLPLNNYYDFTIGLSYYHGFLGLYPKYNKQAMYNRTFNISVGIFFNNKGYKYKYKSRR